MQPQTIPETDFSVIRGQFFEQTSYSSLDLLAWNPVTGKFLTKNGGLYRITEKGELVHIDGPSPDPSERL